MTNKELFIETFPPEYPPSGAEIQRQLFFALKSTCPPKHGAQQVEAHERRIITAGGVVAL